MHTQLHLRRHLTTVATSTSATATAAINTATLTANLAAAAPTATRTAMPMPIGDGPLLGSHRVDTRRGEELWSLARHAT